MRMVSKTSLTFLHFFIEAFIEANQSSARETKQRRKEHTHCNAARELEDALTCKSTISVPSCFSAVQIHLHNLRVNTRGNCCSCSV